MPITCWIWIRHNSSVNPGGRAGLCQVSCLCSMNEAQRNDTKLCARSDPNFAPRKISGLVHSCTETIRWRSTHDPCGQDKHLWWWQHNRFHHLRCQDYNRWPSSSQENYDPKPNQIHCVSLYTWSKVEQVTCWYPPKFLYYIYNDFCLLSRFVKSSIVNFILAETLNTIEWHLTWATKPWPWPWEVESARGQVLTHDEFGNSGRHATTTTMVANLNNPILLPSKWTYLSWAPTPGYTPISKSGVSRGTPPFPGYDKH